MKTTDYDKFSFFNFNREVTGRVEQIKESIKEFGYIEGNPILVDKSFRIVDGQHRFRACQELGLPVVYEFVNGSSNKHKLIVSLNKTQRAWGLRDYIHSWSAKGKKFHKTVECFQEKYGLGISNSIACCASAHFDSGLARKIRSGKSIKMNPYREDVVEFLLQCKDLPFWRTTKFVRATTLLISRGTKKDIDTVIKRHKSIEQQANQGQYLRIFENLINKYRSDNRKVRL